METLRVLVCGGRTYADRNRVYTELNNLTGDITEKTPLGTIQLVIIHGGATGADQLADDWAITNWAPLEVYKAEWVKYGKSAGPIRNKRMLVEGKPDLVLAFPGGKGTANMIVQAKQAGVPVKEIK